MPKACLRYAPPISFSKHLLMEIAEDRGPLQSSRFNNVIEGGQVKSCPLKSSGILPLPSLHPVHHPRSLSCTLQCKKAAQQPQKTPLSLLQKTALPRPSTICIPALFTCKEATENHLSIFLPISKI